MNTHINLIAKLTTINLIKLCKIRKSSPSKTVYTLTNDLLLPRFDVCTNLLTHLKYIKT